MTIHSVALTALGAASRQVDQAAERISRAAVVDPSQADTVDLSQEMVPLLTARTAFQTAVKLARTADEIQKQALNILA